MQTVLASKLSDTRVVSTNGHELGTIHNVTFNTIDGTLTQLVIDTEAQNYSGENKTVTAVFDCQQT